MTLLSSLYFRSENKNNYYYHYCNRKDNVIKKTKGKERKIISLSRMNECRIEEKILVITECAFPSIHSIQFNDDDYSEYKKKSNTIKYNQSVMRRKKENSSEKFFLEFSGFFFRKLKDDVFLSAKVFDFWNIIWWWWWLCYLFSFSPVWHFSKFTFAEKNYRTKESKRVGESYD